MLLTSLVSAHLAGAVGAYFTILSVSTWYVFIEKPDFAPADSVFFPLWLVLYTLMAFAFYLVWRESIWRKDVQTGILWYGASLLLTLLWPILFFGLQNIEYGLIDVLVLMVTVSVTELYFFRVSKVAGVLFLPYLIWVLYAVLLNYVIVLLN